jgi:hypothetical protein
MRGVDAAAKQLQSYRLMQLHGTPSWQLLYKAGVSQVGNEEGIQLLIAKAQELEEASRQHRTALEVSSEQPVQQGMRATYDHDKDKLSIPLMA